MVLARRVYSRLAGPVAYRFSDAPVFEKRRQLRKTEFWFNEKQPEGQNGQRRDAG